MGSSVGLETLLAIARARNGECGRCVEYDPGGLTPVSFCRALAFRVSPPDRAERHQNDGSIFITGMEERGRALPDSYSLVPQETNVRSSDGLASCGTDGHAVAADVAFRHSGWQRNRGRIRSALVASSVPTARLDAWDGCGQDAWVLRSPDPPETFKIVSAKCKDRFCVPCSADRSTRLARRLRERIADMAVSFVTLTLADNNMPLEGLLDKLIASFRKLRQTDLWKRDVRGGVAFIELKWNPKKQRWHPHIHIIMDADHIPQRWLSDSWLAITHTSFRVDIRRADDNDHAIRYLCKYGAKPLHDGFVDDPDRLLEAITTLKGRHLCTVFGDWRDWRLTDDDEHEQWDRVDSLASLLRREARGDPEAQRIMEALRCTTHKTTTPATTPRAPPSNSLPPIQFRVTTPRSACYAGVNSPPTHGVASGPARFVIATDALPEKHACLPWKSFPRGIGLAFLLK